MGFWAYSSIGCVTKILTVLCLYANKLKDIMRGADDNEGKSGG
jgi:hypothetical protein